MWDHWIHQIRAESKAIARWNRFKSVQRWKAASPIVAVAVAGLVFGAYKKSSMEDLQKDLPHVTALTIQPDAPLEKAGGAQEVTWPVIRDIMEITIPDLAPQAKEIKCPISSAKN